MVATMKNAKVFDRKIISISSKRQITIPQRFFDNLGFDSEAECILRGNELVIRPVYKNQGGEFAQQILADLISQGLSGEELLDAFKSAQAKVRPAVEAMIKEAKDAANDKAPYSTYDEIFGSED